MTKKQALQMFTEYIAPSIPKGDTIARRCAWNDFTDSLCKDNEITLRQYESWTNPF
jgi:hypothetical protein